MGFKESIYNHSPVFFQNILISAYGWQWKERRFGGIFKQEFYAAKERENFSVEQWNNYQEEQLRKILLHSFEQVPFYKEAFTRAGLDVRKLSTLQPDSISIIPVLSKQDLRKWGTSTMISSVREKKGDFFSSSGSTGTPTQILFSTAMHQRWMALFEQRVRNWAGVSSFIPRGMIGGRRVLPGAANTPPYYRYNCFEKQAYFSAYHISKNNSNNYLEGMLRHKVEYMTGYAMSNYFLAQFFKETGLEAPVLKAVITSSEKLTPEMRDVFSAVYGCKSYDGWSGVEACGLISECENGRLHISPDAGIIEVLDNNMQSVKAGEAGNVYCTGFVNYDQPLIRYAIGDQIILSNESCACGRNMPVVQEILGRVEDVVIGKDGRKMVRFHSVFNGITAIKKAQVIQENVEHLHIKIVLERSLEKTEEQMIRSRIASQLGTINIQIDAVEEIPLNSNGKFQAVISRIRR